MTRFLMTTAIIGLAASQAAAQGMTYADASLDFTQLSGDGPGELNTTTFEGEIEYQLDSIFLNAYAGSTTFDDDGSFSLTTSEFGVAAGYFVMPEILLGVGVRSLTLDGDGPNEDLTGYEVFGQYDNGQFAGAVNYNTLEADGDEVALTLLAGEVEVMPGTAINFVYETSDDLYDGEAVYVLGADYDVGPIFARGYVFGQTGDFADENIYGVRGHYDFGNNFRVGGGFETATGDFDYSSYSVSAAYEVTQGLWVEGSLGRINIEESEADSLGLSLNYEMGSQTRVDRRMTDKVREDFEDGYLGLFPSFGIGLGGFGFAI